MQLRTEVVAQTLHRPQQLNDADTERRDRRFLRNLSQIRIGRPAFESPFFAFLGFVVIFAAPAVWLLSIQLFAVWVFLGFFGFVRAMGALATRGLPHGVAPWNGILLAIFGSTAYVFALWLVSAIALTTLLMATSFWSFKTELAKIETHLAWNLFHCPCITVLFWGLLFCLTFPRNSGRLG